MLVALRVSLLCGILSAQSIDISNPVGNVAVKVGGVEELSVEGKREDGSTQNGDVTVRRDKGRVHIHAIPKDGKRVDLAVKLPYGEAFSVLTRNGRIEVTGLVRNAELATDSGEIEFNVPWRATRAEVLSEQEPKNVLIRPRFASREAARIKAAAKCGN